MLGSGYVSRVCFGVCFGVCLGGMFRVCFAASGATLPAISGVCYGVCFGGMFRGMLRGMFRGCATRAPFLNLSPPKKHKPISTYQELPSLQHALESENRSTLFGRGGCGAGSPTIRNITTWGTIILGEP